MGAAACPGRPKVIHCPEEDFRSKLAAHVDRYFTLWYATGTGIPPFDRIYGPDQQRANERRTDRFVSWLERELLRFPDSEPERECWRAGIQAAGRRFAQDCLGLPAGGLDLVFSTDGFDATRSFLRQARSFDEAIEPADLSQALRNVWVMNCLQIFLGMRPAVTPSILAYSLLYPYTDNYLDHPLLSAAAKESLNRRLDLRLHGRCVAPGNAREDAIFRLVGMIESQFARNDHPEVYLSLLAIHHGQALSLTQQEARRRLDAEDILRISVEKGGASVLADGYLVAGTLSDAEAGFCFGLGVVLQLADDLQDTRADLDSGRQTVFTREAGLTPLDATANRLLRFASGVLGSPALSPGGRRGQLRDLIRRNSTNLVLRSIAQSPEFFTKAYVRQMERHSPLRFAYLRNREISVEGRFRKAARKLQEKRNGRSLWDLLT